MKLKPAPRGMAKTKGRIGGKMKPVKVSAPTKGKLAKSDYKDQSMGAK